MKIDARWGLALLVAVGVLMGTAGARGQEVAQPGDATVGVDPTPVADGDEAEQAGAADAARPQGQASVGRESLIRLVKQANPMLWPMVLCSVVTIGFGLERWIALRRSRIIPRDFTTRFMDRLTAGKLDRERAVELCRSNDSVVARILGRVVSHWGQPAHVIRELAAQDAAAEISDLKRNVRVLNGTATIAPLLGLLGTVIGMIEAFDSLSGDTGGIGKNEALAHGISLALMATAFGLVIAIASVALYYYFLNKVDVLTRQLDLAATQVVDLVASDGAVRVAMAESRRPASGMAPTEYVR